MRRLGDQARVDEPAGQLAKLFPAAEDADVALAGAVERADGAAGGGLGLTWAVGAATVTIFGVGFGHGPPAVFLARMVREGRVWPHGGAACSR
jgi:hypothetical protein